MQGGTPKALEAPSMSLTHPLGEIETMADNDTPIPGGALARNLFPQTVARLAVQASRAVVLDLCRQALEQGTPCEEIATFLEQLDADCRALIAAAYPNQNRGDV